MSQGKWAPLKAGRGREMDSPTEFPEGISPAGLLMLDSHVGFLQNCEGKN